MSISRPALAANARVQRQNIGPAIGKGIQELPGEIIVGALLVDFGPTLGKSVHHPAKPFALAAHDGIFVQPIQHFEGRFVVSEFFVVERPQEDGLRASPCWDLNSFQIVSHFSWSGLRGRGAGVSVGAGLLQAGVCLAAVLTAAGAECAF